MSSLHTEHFGVPVRDRATQLRAGLGAFLFAISGAAMIWLSVLYVKRDVSASGPSSNRLLSYQVHLTDATGIPLTGTQNLKLSFYNASTGGSPIHTDCGTVGTPVARKVVMADGTATVIIGDTGADGTHNCADASAPNAIPTTLFNNTSLYLGVTVGADTEMSPRKRIVSTGYAANADLLDDLDASAVGGSVAFVPVTDSSGNLTLTQNMTVDATTFFVDSSNNRVGIGTITPSRSLSVVNTIGGGGIYIERSAGSTPFIEMNQTGAAADLGRWRMGANSDGTFFLVPTADNGSTAFNGLSVSHNGNFGIELASLVLPVTRLDVNGNIRATGKATAVLTGSIDPAASTTVTGVGTLFTTQLVVGDRITVTGETRTVTAIASATSLTVDAAFSNNANDTSPDVLYALATMRDSSNSTQFVVNDLGYVGIGTTSPVDALHVLVPQTIGTNGPNANSFAVARFVIRTTADGFERGIELGGPTTTISDAPAYVKVQGTSNRFGILNENNSEQLSILTNGNVGIANTAPVARFDLGGNLRTTGRATAVLTGTIDPIASTTVTGVGTLFTTQLVVGDRITVTGETRTVTAIASNTSLTVNTAFSDNANDTSPDVLYALATIRDSSNAPKLTVNDLGSVGIGTSSPGEKLEVVGNIISKGTEWTSRTHSVANSFLSVTYGNGLFVAVTETATTNGVMTSPDGINWTTRTTPNTNSWFDVTYGNGLFVAVGFTGTGNRVMTSPDGITWTARTTPVDNDWREVVYGNGQFVAVSFDGTNNDIMTSPDGITWTSRTTPGPTGQLWWGFTYGNGLFVAVAGNCTVSGCIMTSTDAITWTLRTPATYDAWESVTYGNGLFVAVGQTGTGNRVMTSPDGITWTSRASAADNAWFSVTYGAGLFVAVANSGAGPRVMTSPDGITWTSRAAAENNAWYSVVYGDGMFVAVSQDGTNRVMTSGKSDHQSVSNNNIFQGGMSIFGNVGVGTSAPSTKLHVTGTSDVARLSNAVSTGYVSQEWEVGGSVQGRVYSFGPTYATSGRLIANSMLIEATTTAGLGLSAGGAAPINFYTTTAQRMVIDSSGNVGIGDASPSALFTVGNGDLFRVDSTGAIASSTGITNSGNTTLGDAGADTLTFNAASLSIPNNLNVDGGTLFVDSTNNIVSVGSSTPVTGTWSGSLTVDSTGLSRIPLVTHTNFAVGAELYTHSDTGFRGPVLDLFRSRNTASSPTAVQAGDVLGYFGVGGYDGATYGYGYQLVGAAGQNWTGSSRPMQLSFQTTKTGSILLSERMRFDSNGNMGVNFGGALPLTQLDLAGNLRTTGKATAVLTGSIDPAASTTVTGVGTLFTTELVVGDRITVTGETRTVTAIASATSLTVDSAFTDNANDASPDALYALSTQRLSSNAFANTVNDLGNVGLGTAAPSQRLTVQGNIQVQSTGDADILFAKNLSGTPSYAAIKYDVTSGGFDFRLGSATTPAPGASSKMVLRDNGNLGVGTGDPFTLPPLTRLDVGGNMRLTGKATSVLTGSIDPAASTAVTGVGTLFTTELVVGDRITVTGETRTVTVIASATSLTVDIAFSDNANDTSPDVLYALATMRDSSNAPKLIVNDLGNVGIGAFVNDSSRLDVAYTSTATSSANIGVRSVVTANPASAPASGTTYRAMTYQVATSADAIDHSNTILYGVNGQATHGGTATLGNMSGITSGIFNTSTGTITAAYGYTFGASNPSGTIGTFVGYQAPDASSLASTYYAFQALASVGANKYNVYASGTAQNYFAGKVGMGETVPAVQLHVKDASGDGITILRLEDSNSTCNFTADTGSPLCGSDRTLKKDIAEMEGSLDIVRALKPSFYRWLTEDEADALHAGFIAQEVAEVLPQMVQDGTWVDGSTRKFLRMGDMLPYLAGAIKELDAKIAATSLSNIGSLLDLQGNAIIGVGSFEGMGGAWHIDSTGALVASEITIEQVTVRRTDARKTIGTVTIPSGESLVQLHDASVTPLSKVFITLRKNSGSTAWVEEIGDGFAVIKVSAPTTEDIPVDYWIIGVQDDTSLTDSPESEPVPSESPPEPLSEETAP